MSSKEKSDKKNREVAELLARARAPADLSEKGALQLAVKETRASRAERATRR